MDDLLYASKRRDVPSLLALPSLEVVVEVRKGLCCMLSSSFFSHPCERTQNGSNREAGRWLWHDEVLTRRANVDVRCSGLFARQSTTSPLVSRPSQSVSGWLRGLLRAYNHFFVFFSS